jgi:hypothetical protein
MTKDILSDEAFIELRKTTEIYHAPQIEKALNTIEHYQAESEAKDAQIQVLVEALGRYGNEGLWFDENKPSGNILRKNVFYFDNAFNIAKKALATTPAKALEVRRAEQAVIDAAMDYWQFEGDIETEEHSKLFTAFSGAAEALQAVKEK